jgi:hypothetical protein
MKFKLFFQAVACLYAIIGIAYGQTPQVNNSGFENWETTTNEKAEPLEWNSFKTASGSLASFGSQQLNRSTDVRPGSSGIYSAYIWAKFVVVSIANGNLTTSRINMGSTTPSNSSNYNYTVTSNSAFCETLGGHPDSLVVWVKTIIANSSNQPRIRAVIHDTYDYRDPSGSDANSPNHVVANATLNFTSVNNVWLRKSIPFSYTGPATSPNYIMVTFTTCKDPGVGTANDAFYIDDLLLVYNPTLTTGAINTLTYNVTPNTGASVTVPFTLTGSMNPNNNKPNNVVTAQLSDANGSFANPIILGTLTTTTSGSINGTIPAGTPTGSGYRIRVVSSNYPLTAADNGSNIQIIYIAPKTLNVKVFVEGLYNGGGMMHEARDLFVDPNPPYDAYFIEKWGAGIADTVTVELYDDTYLNKVARYTGVNLGTNGVLTIPTVNASLDRSYYITILQRNSLPITTNGAQSFAGSSIYYDFTNAMNKAFDASAFNPPNYDPQFVPQKDLGDGYFGMWTGALDQINDPDYIMNINVLNIEILAVEVPGPHSYGYFDFDLDGSGYTDVVDQNMLIPNVENLLNVRFYPPSMFAGAKKKITPINMYK